MLRTVIGSKTNHSIHKVFNGDGLVDQVMRVPGSGVWTNLNLSGQVGLLKTIQLPQGGRHELSYRREGNTPRRETQWCQAPFFWINFYRITRQSPPFRGL
jgi:hypothetical protein